MERRVLLSAGDLDPAFGTGGILHTPDPYQGDVLVQPDGKILSVGITGGESFLRRYNPNGTPDTSFGGGDGLVLFPSVHLTTLALQPDGKILVAETVIARYHSNGTLDTSFGGDGIVTNEIDINSFVIRDLEVLDDGRILAMDNRRASYGPVVMALEADGSLDQQFGNSGRVKLEAAAAFHPSEMTVRDGFVYVAGQAVVDNDNADLVVAKMGLDGQFDSAFGTGGISIVDLGAGRSSAITSLVRGNGKILLSAAWNVDSGFLAQSRASLVQLDVDGSLDTAFGGGDGIVVTKFPPELLGMGFPAEGFTFVPSDMELTDDGKIIAASSFENASEETVGLVRYNLDGSLDPSFSEDGRVVVSDLDVPFITTVRVALADEGDKILVGTNRHILRFLGAGDNQQDPVALDDGILQIVGDDEGNSIVVRRDGAQVTVTFDDLTETFAAADVDRVVISAGGGNDTVRVGDDVAPVFVSGGTGNDRLTTGDGDDTLEGNEGNDTLTAGDGDDSLDGGFGDDLLDGRLGSDTMVGGGGADADDVVTYAGRTQDLTIRLDGKAGDGAAGENDFIDRDIRAVHGGDGDDLIVGNDAGVTLRGGDGDDTLLGGDWHDSLYGDDGDDLLDAGLESDLIVGGRGFDTADYSSRTHKLVIDLDGKANDGEKRNGGERDNVTASVDAILGGSAADVLRGDDDHNRLVGGAGFDWIKGRGGNDQIVGGAGDDTVYADEGNDTLDGDQGSDQLYGEQGIDTIDYSSRTADLDISLDRDRNDGQAGENDYLKGFEVVLGGSGDDLVVGTGAHRETLHGNDGNDTLRGGGNNDALYGGRGDDLLNGGGGADFMSGGSGFDRVDYRSRGRRVFVDFDGNADDGVAGERDNAFTDLEQVLT